MFFVSSCSSSSLTLFYTCIGCPFGKRQRPTPETHRVRLGRLIQIRTKQKIEREYQKNFINHSCPSLMEKYANAHTYSYTPSVLHVILLLMKRLELTPFLFLFFFFFGSLLPQPSISVRRVRRSCPNWARREGQRATVV